jgi:hypothetical protein
VLDTYAPVAKHLGRLLTEGDGWTNWLELATLPAGLSHWGQMFGEPSPLAIRGHPNHAAGTPSFKGRTCVRRAASTEGQDLLASLYPPGLSPPPGLIDLARSVA